MKYNIEIVIRNPKDLTMCYYIKMYDDNSVWITRGDGEGGQFSIQDLFDMIDEFYAEYF